MSVLVLLIPVTFCLGLTGLIAFLWNLRSGQYEDLSGAAERILLDEHDAPAGPVAPPSPHGPRLSTRTKE
jgi:cbb3-type cytochrome oxidase maturation protein